MFKSFKRQPTTLYSNEGTVQLAVAVIVTLLIAAAAGFIAIWLVKSGKLKKMCPEYYTSPWRMGLLSLTISVILLIGTFASMALLSMGPVVGSGAFSKSTSIALAIVALKYAATLWVGMIASQYFSAKIEDRKQLAKASLVSSAALAAVFLPWPAINSDLHSLGSLTIVNTVSDHLFWSIQFPFIVFSQLVQGTTEVWYYPIIFIISTIKQEGGNQFALAEYYPAILFVWACGSIVGILGGMLGLGHQASS